MEPSSKFTAKFTADGLSLEIATTTADRRTPGGWPGPVENEGVHVQGISSAAVLAQRILAPSAQF